MSVELSSGTGRRYGLLLVGRIWSISRARYRRRAQKLPQPRKRPGPIGPITDSALEPIKQAVRKRFGAFAKPIATGLKLRHDHGSH